MDYYIKKVRRRRAKKVLLVFVFTFFIFVIGIAVNIIIFSKASAKFANAGIDKNINEELKEFEQTSITYNGSEIIQTTQAAEESTDIERDNYITNNVLDVNQCEPTEEDSIYVEKDGDLKRKVDNSGYNYSMSVPENDPVDESFFESALFIGNSRVEGLALYSAPKGATFYTHEGLLIDNALKKEIIRISTKQHKISIKEAISINKFDSIYIMFGINELGWVYPNVFIDYYKELIYELQKQIPDANIYVQSILPVTEKKSISTDIYTNDHILEFNALLKKMCKEVKVYYLDTWQSVADANGVLPKEASVDGVHLVKKYTDIWLDYIKRHTVK